MRRTVLLVALAGIILITVVSGWRPGPTAAQQPPPVAPKPSRPTAPLPITQVVFFSSGVGYFQREGEVEGHARVDLSFPSNDVNDLLKSLVLQDMGGGKISAISYDSHDPIEKTLKSFALDLTYNPTFGQIINQARGEKVEVVTHQGTTTQPGTLTGVVVGMEDQLHRAGEDDKAKPGPNTERLNLLCTEGMRSILLTDIQRIRFLNAALDSEFRRALEVLATTHDTQKKAVSLSFNGDGKRPVRVGYVVENPIWKTSYRLVVGKDNKLYLQGWAVVENTTDDDWNQVRVSLISGRPISFQMNLYQPLYIPRPVVEPELFASLRPPAYEGAMSQLGGIAGLGGGAGGLPPALMFGNRYQMNGVFGNAVSQLGLAGGGPPNNGRLTYEQLQERRQGQQQPAKEPNQPPAGVDPQESVASVAVVEDVGDSFRYLIEQSVTLPRQKSAMLPIVAQNIEGTRVSIFNEKVHAKFPLLGLKFKNTSGLHLVQGPITVYEGDTYAGDARVMDLQPNEERLLSYAIDLGTEVKIDAKDAPDQLIAVKLVRGALHSTHKLRETRSYLIKNRSTHDRQLIIEHPIRSDWKLVTPEKPSERSRDLYRFQVAVAAGKALTHQVVEEQTRFDRTALASAEDRTVLLFQNSTVSSPAVRAALKKAMDFKARLGDTQRELTQLEKKLKTITDDQTRLRANLDKVPPTSAAHKRYLEKFDTQETAIEQLQGQIQQKQEVEKKQQKEYEDYLANLNVE